MKSDILKDKIIIVAGGCGRIGREFVEAIYDNNGIAIIADDNHELAKLILSDLQKKHKTNKGECFSIDMLSKLSITSLINNIKEKYGKIDVFVNTIYPPWKEGDHSVETISLDLFNNGVNKHLGAYFLASQQFTNYFKKQGYGNLINVSSIQGCANPKFDTYKDVEINGKPMFSPIEYSCIKSAINSMTTYLAKYYLKDNIRCNIISPGGIESGQPKKFLEQYKSHCGTKGMLSGKDIAGAFVFLASDLSNHITGQNIIIDDGWIL